MQVDGQSIHDGHLFRVSSFKTAFVHPNSEIRSQMRSYSPTILATSSFTTSSHQAHGISPMVCPQTPLKKKKVKGFPSRDRGYRVHEFMRSIVHRSVNSSQIYRGIIINERTFLTIFPVLGLAFHELLWVLIRGNSRTCTRSHPVSDRSPYSHQL